MLRIINDLKYFFEDNYKRIHVREYAKLHKISPPTASKLLEDLKNKGLLKKEIDKKYFYYYANKESADFIDLQRMYYRNKLADFIKYINEETINPDIYLFGSVAKAEIKEDSDIDIAIITHTQKTLKINSFEKKIRRKIQLFMFKNIENISTELKNNILNGYKIRGD